MKIGHYAPALWAKGGVASYIRRVSGEQKRLGHEIMYFDLASEHIDGGREEAPQTVTDEAALFREATAKELDILHVHMGLAESPPSSLTVLRTVHGHQPYCPSGGRFLKRLEQPCPRAYSLVGCVANHFFNHCGSIRPASMAAEFRNTWNEMRTLRAIPAITVSDFLKAQMVRSGYQKENIHVLHLPAPDVKTYTPLSGEGIPRFVFLGRITALKGVGWLLRAAKEVRTPIHLDIAGEGDDEPAMRRLSVQLGLEDRVTFHGWVGPEQVNALLVGARALVFPSIWHEPGGTVAFEAMVSGRAVIMSRVGGMPEVITEGSNGLLVEPNDTVGLARAMTRLAENGAEAQRMGEAGRELAASKFTLNQHVASLMELYDRCRQADPALVAGAS